MIWEAPDLTLGHSPRESRGHCGSEYIGEAYGGNFRSETLGRQ